MLRPFLSAAVLALAAAVVPAQNSVSISFGNVEYCNLGPQGSGSVEVLYNSNFDFAGFNFDILDNMGLTLTGVHGGDAEAHGFNIDVGSYINTTCSGSCTVFAFVISGITGTPIPAGGGLLTRVDFVGDVGSIAAFDPVNPVFASSAGVSYVPIVGPSISILPPPPPTYPGTGDDFIMSSALGTDDLTACSDVKAATIGSLLKLRLSSPGGTLDYAPLILVADFFFTGGPSPVGFLPELHVGPSLFILVDGLQGLPQVVVPGGNDFNFLAPPGFFGLSFIFQGAAVSPSAANGFIAITNGHEIQMQ